MCVCVCVFDCLGSQRLTEPEFDEGTAVMSKGGWGYFLIQHIALPKACIFITGDVFGSEKCLDSFMSKFVCLNDALILKTLKLKKFSTYL